MVGAWVGGVWFGHGENQRSMFGPLDIPAEYLKVVRLGRRFAHVGVLAAWVA